MGGDHAPLEVVVGTLAWARSHPADHILLVGIPERIKDAAGGPMPDNVEIVPASQVVEMDESPALALKAKKDSSIMVAMDLLKQGRADALVTAGFSPSNYVGTGGQIKRGDLGTINRAGVPAILIECGNMHNAADLATMRSPAGRQRLADAIASGLATYLAGVGR